MALTLQQAAGYTQKSEQTILRRVKKGDLPYTKDSGNRWQFLQADIDRVFFGKPVPAVGPCWIIGISNQKGGVGKTTIASNLAAALAETGAHVLAIDCDPQGNMTQALGLNSNTLDVTIYNALVEGTKLSNAIKQPFPNLPTLSVVGANLDLAEAEMQLGTALARESLLRTLLEPHLLDYDYILLDSPPTLGLLTLNVLSCCNQVVIPVDMAPFAIRGVDKLIRTISTVQSKINPKLTRISVLCNLVENTNIVSDVKESLSKTFGSNLLTTTLRKSVRVKEAQAARQPLLLYKPADAATREYQALAQEVKEHVGQGSA